MRVNVGVDVDVEDVDVGDDGILVCAYGCVWMSACMTVACDRPKGRSTS
jgi:hypothetical protein